MITKIRSGDEGVQRLIPRNFKATQAGMTLEEA